MSTCYPSASVLPQAPVKHPRLASGAVNVCADHTLWEANRPSHFLLWIPREEQLLPPGNLVRGLGVLGGPRARPLRVSVRSPLFTSFHRG